MKLKRASLIFSTLIILSAPAFADSGPAFVDVTATTCDSCFGNQIVQSIDLQAQLTIEPMTGEFFNSGGDYIFHGTVDRVIGITGTLNGRPMALIPAPYGDGSWLSSPAPGSYSLGTVYFSAGGSVCWLQNDNAFNLIEILSSNGDGSGTSTPIYWGAVQVPEPNCLSLLTAGLIGIVLLKLRLA